MNKYRIEIEIYEGKGSQLDREGDKIIYPDLVGEGICAWMYRGDGQQSYQVGQRFAYPEDIGKLCPWLLDSLHSVIQVLRDGRMDNHKEEQSDAIQEEALGGFACRAPGTGDMLLMHSLGRETLSELHLVRDCVVGGE